MDVELLDKLYEIISLIDNSDEMKKMMKLKKEIYEDRELKFKLDEFNKIKDDVYNPKYLELKKEILAFDTIREYKKMENELYLLVLAINKKLNSLIK